LEQMYKAKWRKSYSAGEQREFSRVSNVIKAIKKRRSDGEELMTVKIRLKYLGRSSVPLRRGRLLPQLGDHVCL
jgi:hypothetical protein